MKKKRGKHLPVPLVSDEFVECCGDDDDDADDDDCDGDGICRVLWCVWWVVLDKFVVMNLLCAVVCVFVGCFSSDGL